MWLSPRLWRRKRQLRHQPVPCDGEPLTGAECYQLEVAAFALIDEEGTRRVAKEAARAETLAAAEEWGGE